MHRWTMSSRLTDFHKCDVPAITFSMAQFCSSLSVRHDIPSSPIRITHFSTAPSQSALRVYVLVILKLILEGGLPVSYPTMQQWIPLTCGESGKGWLTSASPWAPWEQLCSVAPEIEDRRTNCSAACDWKCNHLILLPHSQLNSHCSGPILPFSAPLFFFFCLFFFFTISYLCCVLCVCPIRCWARQQRRTCNPLC